MSLPTNFENSTGWNKDYKILDYLRDEGEERLETPFSFQILANPPREKVYEIINYLNNLINGTEAFNAINSPDLQAVVLSQKFDFSYDMDALPDDGTVPFKCYTGGTGTTTINSGVLECSGNTGSVYREYRVNNSMAIAADDIVFAECNAKYLAGSANKSNPVLIADGAKVFSLGLNSTGLTYFNGSTWVTIDNTITPGNLNNFKVLKDGASNYYVFVNNVLKAKIPYASAYSAPAWGASVRFGAGIIGVTALTTIGISYFKASIIKKETMPKLYGNEIYTSDGTNSIKISGSKIETTGTNQNMESLPNGAGKHIDSKMVFNSSAVYLKDSIFNNEMSKLCFDIASFLTDKTQFKAAWPCGISSGTSLQNFGSANHVFTLDTDAANLSPGGIYQERFLTFANSHYAYINSNSDFQPGNGSSDVAFTIIALVKMADVTSKTLLAKWNEYTTSPAREWRLMSDASDALGLTRFDESTDGYRSSWTTPITGYQNAWTSIIVAAGTGDYTDVDLYVNGADLYTGGTNSGSYTAMEALATNVETCYKNTSNARTAYFEGLAAFFGLIKGAKLGADAAYWTDKRLRRLAGGLS